MCNRGVAEVTIQHKTECVYFEVGIEAEETTEHQACNTKCVQVSIERVRQ